MPYVMLIYFWCTCLSMERQEKRCAVCNRPIPEPAPMGYSDGTEEWWVCEDHVSIFNEITDPDPPNGKHHFKIISDDDEV